MEENSLLLSTLPAPSELLPHGSGMTFIDSVLSCDDTKVVCRVVVNPERETNQAMKKLPVFVGLEYMAQAAAVQGGIHARQTEDEPPVGVVLGSRCIECKTSSFSNGQELQVSAILQYNQPPMRIFECAIYDTASQKLLMQGEINIYIFAT